MSFTTSTTTSTSQTALQFNVEEYRKASERKFQQLGVRVHDRNGGTLDTHKSSVFQCTSQIRARITPEDVSQIYILDFIDNDGNRIEGRTGLVVFDGKENNPDRYMMEPAMRCISPYSISEPETLPAPHRRV